MKSEPHKEFLQPIKEFFTTGVAPHLLDNDNNDKNHKLPLDFSFYLLVSFINFSLFNLL